MSGYKNLIKHGTRPTVIAYMPVPDNPTLMRVVRKSDLTNKEHTMDLPITEDQLQNWLGTTRLIQDVMPHLNKEQREFLISGCTPQEWDEAFPPGED